MRIVRLLGSFQVLSLVMLLPLAVHAEPWHADGCDPALEAEFQAYDQSVRSASPGSSTYTPKPFPKTASDVMTDARSAYLRLYPDRAKLPKFEKKFYSWLTSGKFTYRVDRVANWTPARCRGGDRHLSYFLVTLRDIGEGRPLGRMALNEAGLLMEWAPNPLEELPPIGDVATSVARQFQLAITKPQFVAVWGDLDCYSPLDPCLAFEANGKNYLFFVRNGLFAFETGSRIAASEASAIRNFTTYQAAKAKLAADEALVSLASENWARARRVQPPG
jgi:hypothetical protein